MNSFSSGPLLALTGGAVAIGLSPIFVRLADVGETSAAFWRLALSLPLLAVLARRGSGLRVPNGQLRLWLLAGLFFALDLAVWHQSIRLTSVANATLLANLAPIFVVLFGWWLFGERVKARFLIGLVVALAGCVVLMSRSGAGVPASLAGDALGVLTAVFYAGYILAVTRARRHSGVIGLMFWTTAISAFLLLPLALWVDGAQFWPQSLRGWLLLLGLAWSSQVAGQGLIAYAMAYLPAAFSSVSLLIQPVAAALFAVCLLGESLGPLQITAAITVLAGILWCRLSMLRS